MAHQEMLVAWLNDAHAMENGIAEALEAQVKLAEDHPTVQAGLQQHLEATRRHAETVKDCLEQLGERPSGVKSALAAFGGKLQAAMGSARDDLVKAALNDYATEHMEIASYRALIIAANEAGQPSIAEACQGILQDEEQMARWLEENTPALVREALVRGET